MSQALGSWDNTFYPFIVAFNLWNVCSYDRLCSSIEVNNKKKNSPKKKKKPSVLKTVLTDGYKALTLETIDVQNLLKESSP